MNDLLERFQEYLSSRSPRERWLGVLVACVVGVLALQTIVLSPMQTQRNRATRASQELETDLLRSERMAREIRTLQGDLALVEARIKPGEKTNLFTLLESLAAQAQIAQQLESIKPKQAAGNEEYPETRVEVTLRGTTLKQAVQFLYQIETAPVLLIIRSLRIKSRSDDSGLLDLTFSVSSFERT